MNEIEYKPDTPVYVAFQWSSSTTNGRIIEFVDVTKLRCPSVGGRLRYFRKLKRLSKHQLGKRAKVSVEDIDLAERNPGNTPLEVFEKLCPVLGCKMDQLTESVCIII